jgi:hypothetical protein
MDATDLSTQVAKCTSQTICTWEARPFNFADLHGPIPASVYFGGEGIDLAMFNGRTSQGTIVEGNYWPTIVLPKEITSVAPDLFASCSVRYTWSEWIENDLVHPITTMYGFRRGVWDPPVALQPITDIADSPPSFPITFESQPHPSASVVGEQLPLLHTPVSTSTGSHPTGPSREWTDSEDDNAADSSRNSAPTVTTITFRSTSSSLPDSVLARMGSRNILVGGPALALENTVISRALNGDYIIESSRIYDLRSNTYRKSSPTRSKGGQISDKKTGIPISVATRTIKSALQWRWIYIFSFLVTFMI